jgi:hypothetical membrane protein
LRNAVTLVGLLGPIILALSTIIAIAFAPWFNIFVNPLSDLGDPQLATSTSWIFDLGLILSGIMIASFAVLLRTLPGAEKQAWQITLATGGSGLALIGIVPETFLLIHLAIAIPSLALADFSMVLYGLAHLKESQRNYGMLVLLFGIVSFSVWIVRWPWHGVALQESIGSTLVMIWILTIALKNRKAAPVSSNRTVDYSSHYLQK